MDDAKLKRWGWGAIIGLIGVILVAGLVVAISVSSPKPSTTETATGEIKIADGGNGEEKKADEDKKAAEEKKADEEKKAAEQKEAEEAKKKEEEQKAAEQKIAAQKEAEQKRVAEEEKARAEAEQKSAAAGSNKMPKTGPEDTTFAVIGASVVAYLIVLNFGLAKKRA